MPVRSQTRQILGALFFLTAISLAAPLWAQKDAGAIVGLVRDASGAVIADAKVTVTDVDRGTQLSLSTNHQGEYVASPLRIGQYTVTVEKAGFKKAVAGPVQVNIQDRVGVDLTLHPGTATETMTVTAEGAQLETETSDLGQVVDSRRINALPLNGRNYAQLALLGTGVAAAEPGSRVETTYGFSANGARSLQNNFLLDGIDNNANLGDVLNGAAYVVQPAVDAIAEFKVETNSYSAEFGRGNGAIMNAVIKSGTNQFHGDLWEFLRNDKFDAINPFDAEFGQQPYKQNQFGFTLGGPIKKNKLFFFGDYEGLRIRQALPQLSTVPTPAEIGGDFSAFLQLSNPVAGVVDCGGNPTYQGEIFNPVLAQSNSALNGGAGCSVPIGTTSIGVPTNIFQGNSGTNTAIDPLAQELANLFPQPNSTLPGGNYLADPERNETENKFDIRIDVAVSNKDNFFARYSYGKDTNFLPSPFNNILDGGSFQDGYSDNTAQGLAASEIHTFRNNLVNEFRFGFNYLNSHRYNLFSNVNVAQQIPGGISFPGVPFEAGQNIGGLPYLSFGDGTASIGASEFLPAVENQHSYVFTDNVIWTRGRHSAKFGGELRFEQFTILEPAAARGAMDFGQNFVINDNLASPGSGGEAFASFMQGIPDGGSITSVTPNIIYKRQIYSVYALDDFKATPRLTLNLGLRYEMFTTIKEANNNQATFDFSTLALLAPKGQNTQLTPTLGTELSIQNIGSRGLISPDLNNFAPRIGLAYQVSNKLVVRSGFGIFYGGQENGPFSNPSPGFNPPFLSSEAFNTPCTAPTANAAQTDCSISAVNNGGLPLNVLSQGFPAKSLSDPNAPVLYSLDPHLVTPYTEQWHLGFEYQLPADTVLEVSYAGSHGLKLFAFYNGNQAVPVVGTDSLPTAPRRPAQNNNWPGANGPCDLNPANNYADASNCNPALDVMIDTFRSNSLSNYNSMQVRLEKRSSHGLQYELAYTWAHALDTASSASLGSVNNGDFQDQRFPQTNYGNSDFDVRQRLVFSYMYDLPFGRGRKFAASASGAINRIIGNWQLAGVFTAATGNYYTATDINNVSGGDCGGTVGYYCSRPNLVGNPNARPCIPGTLFNTCAFADNTNLGTFGNAGRNIVEGPGYKTWDTAVMKQFPISEQKKFEFRAEFFNVLNHVNYLFGQFGAISAEPTPLELGQSGFGFPLASRAPRQIQFALKFYF
jgi:hypothetical protein